MAEQKSMALPRSSTRSAVVLGLAVSHFACQSPLPAWDPHADSADGGAPGDAQRELRLRFDPPASADAVTRVTQVEVELGSALASPRVLLVQGSLTATQLRDLARPVLTQTLAVRARPTMAWTSSETSLVVAPLEVLTAGTLYTVGVSDPPAALSFTVAAEDRIVILPRVWPAREDAAPLATAAAWCGRDALAVVDGAATLAPAAIAGQLAAGTGGAVSAARCVSWLAAGPPNFPQASAATPALTPAWVPLAGGALALLEPIVLWPAAQMPEREPITCGPAEARFGPGCATVDDDRILVRPPEGPVLWTIETGAGTLVRQSREARAFVVRPLPPEERFRVSVLDESGRRLDDEVQFHPAPARAHVIINEVMANPAGVERAQEWVELFNDGLFAMPMGGYGLETGGGTAVLPAGTLAPGAFALVVTDAFTEDDGIDPVAAPGTLILRVPALGRDGLSNEGERLVLRDAAGAVLSTFPAMKAKNGVSNVRLDPDAFDVDADSFAPSANGSATPGAANIRP